LIPVVRFERSGLQTSKLAFGLSRIHYLSSTRERQNLLARAADLGIRHFDAARSYGDGLAEATLGCFLSGRRSNFIVATKFGLAANRLIEAAPLAAQPLRALRSIVRRVRPGFPSYPMLTGAGLRVSVERSLRALRIDFIDILFLHEPSLVRLAEAEELLAEVDRQKSKGTIRFIGLAGGWMQTIEIVKSSLSLADVVQVPENDWSDTELVPDLTFGALCREPQSVFEGALESDLVLHRLEAALRRRKNGSVVVSTTRIDHLDLLASAALGSTLD
jgi:aryl-alcohol dehydrogenase-like predicted oxidoreductase